MGGSDLDENAGSVLSDNQHVKTIDRVAAELGETVDRIFDLAIDMATEDGVIWVYGPGDDSVIAFTPFGIENLQ